MKRLSEQKIVLCAMALVLLLWCVNWAALLCPISTRGILGDMFGVTNSLFSGLGLCGVVYALIMQREDLLFNRTELEKSERARHNEAKWNANQKFEETFYTILKFFIEVRENIKIPTPYGVEKAGQGALAFLYTERLLASFSEQQRSGGKLCTKEIACDFYTQYKPYLCNYIKTLYGLLKFICDRDFPSAGRCHSTVVTFLSPEEIAIISFLSLADINLHEAAIEAGLFVSYDWTSILCTDGHRKITLIAGDEVSGRGETEGRP